MKKIYVNPVCEIFNTEVKAAILSGSNFLDNEDNGDAGVKADDILDDEEIWK